MPVCFSKDDETGQLMPLPAPLHPFLSSSLLPPGFGSKMGQPLRCGRRRRGAFCGDSVAKPLPQFERERKTQLRDARIRIAILILADVPLLLKISTFYSREHICLPCTEWSWRASRFRAPHYKSSCHASAAGKSSPRSRQAFQFLCGVSGVPLGVSGD